MSTALFVRHKAKPGKRDEIRRVWEKYVKPHVTTNSGHEAYYFCYDQEDPDAINVFQLYPSLEASKRFMKEPWYNEYLQELRPFIARPPMFTVCDLMWAQVSGPQG